ncbi:probable VPS28 - protein involved in vacuolar traffic [Melanopsichium pennsylvanicum]|uniref:Vacuolar protein sorting-associated protein 28 n=2 Tax=Melanopsichium pennsylvanicum TaxID=63383 RepID=A0AAJ5C8J4_9BASI|nr:probable VPS28-protein involved in vacuolar traffic [Melanopsichium pennsylvanicum 4]SNX87628.1 probable VPS28 - protein involved in vacuolar traffic [Melanopsichium pennsylvanicum]
MSTSSYANLNPYEEARLYTNNHDRERYENMATLFSLIVALDYLERAYVRESISENEYAPACTRLLAQYKTMLKLIVDQENNSSKPIHHLSDFMRIYNMNYLAAFHRFNVGVPATVEHASTNSSQTSSERAKWVAETTQNFITFMDALKLKLRAKDQLHPMLSDLMRGYSRSDDVTKHGEAQETRAKLLKWLITLNQMKASDEIDEHQARQMLFDVEGAYNSFFRALHD